MFALKLITTTVIMSLSSIAHAEKVEITLVDNLDGDLNSYCLDILGSQSRAKPEEGMQAHTCYSYQGDLGIDQIFETERFDDSVLYMPEFDVCATISGSEAGATVGLANCDGREAQKIVLTDTGKLSPAAATDMCLTAGEETRLGRGGTSRHQIKLLTLQACSDNLKDFQTWRARSENI